MRVVFLHSLISNVSPYRAGDVADLDEATAIKYIQRGLCKPAPVQKVNIKGDDLVKILEAETARAKPQAERAIHQPEVIEPEQPKRRTRRKRNA